MYYKLHYNNTSTTHRSRVGLNPRKKTLKPLVPYECRIVDIVVRYGLISDCIVLRASVLCMRVLTTSSGNVGSQPTTPATPPLTSNTHRGGDPAWLESNSKLELLSPNEGGAVRYRAAASYCLGDVNRGNIIGCGGTYPQEVCAISNITKGCGCETTIQPLESVFPIYIG